MTDPVLGDLVQQEVIRTLDDETVAALVPATLALIERAVRDPAVDVEKLERMLALQERLLARDAEGQFNAAKARIKKKLAGIRIVKNRSSMYDIDKNDKGKGQYEAFKYAPLEEIDKHLAPLLAEEDMDLSYTVEPREGGGGIIIGRLKHLPSGHFEDSTMPLPLDTTGGKNNIQGMGSTNNYGRRYIACNIFNIVVVGDDDDGSGGFIDAPQLAQLRQLITQLAKKDPKKSEARFCQFMQVPSLDALPAKRYRQAFSALEERCQKMGIKVNADIS